MGRRGGEPLLRGKAEEEDGGEERSVRASAASPPPPTYSLVRRSRGGEAWVGRGSNCTHSPTSRDYGALKTCRNRRRKTCGLFWAAENPRLGLGVGVMGPWPAATSCRACGLAGFFQPEGATWYAGGERPAAARRAHQPTLAFRLQKFRQDGAPNRSRLPAAGSSR